MALSVSALIVKYFRPISVISVKEMHKSMAIILEKKGIYSKIFSRTNYGKYSTKNKVIDILNRIPLNIICSAFIKIFKRKLKCFLLSHVVIGK